MITFVQYDTDLPNFARAGNALRDMHIQCSIRGTGASEPRELVIEDAPPQVRIPVEPLMFIAKGHFPHLQLVPPTEPVQSKDPMTWGDVQLWHEALGARPEGALLRIQTSNRTLIYRITNYLIQSDLFTAEWPD